MLEADTMHFWSSEHATYQSGHERTKLGLRLRIGIVSRAKHERRRIGLYSLEGEEAAIRSTHRFGNTTGLSSTIRLLGGFVILLGLAIGSNASAQPAKAVQDATVRLPTHAGASIELVASLPDLLPNGVAVSPTGRIFVSLPRWAGKQTPGVIELLPDGNFRPFPGGSWSNWQPGMRSDHAFVSVRSINTDQDGNLWVVDEGPPAPALRDAQYAEVRPKIVQIDLATGEVVEIYPISSAAAPPGSNFGHMRLDRNFLYLSEPGTGSLIVIDRKTKEIHRRLASARAAKADPTVIPAFAGVPIAAPSKVPQVHLDHIEIGADDKKLYFMSLFGPTLYSVKIADLTNWALSDKDLEQRISVEGPVPPATGLRRDAKGNLYICAITEFAIMRRTNKGAWKIVSRDPRIYVPNSPSFGPDGSLYFPVSRLPGFPDIGVSGPSAVYRIQPGRKQYR